MHSRNHIKFHRREYKDSSLSEEDINVCPFEQFDTWIQQVLEKGILDATAMSLSTVSTDNRPKSRIVLLKEYSKEGFIFFGDYKSQKGDNLSYKPYASLLFYWPLLCKQVRIEGKVHYMNENDANKYFQSRPVTSQIAASLFTQSQVIRDRDTLEQSYKMKLQEYEINHKTDKPQHWGGWILKPDKFEFWQGRENRLHDRIEYIMQNNIWVTRRLAP